MRRVLGAWQGLIEERWWRTQIGMRDHEIQHLVLQVVHSPACAKAACLDASNASMLSSLCKISASVKMKPVGRLFANCKAKQ